MRIYISPNPKDFEEVLKPLTYSFHKKGHEILYQEKTSTGNVYRPEEVFEERRKLIFGSDVFLSFLDLMGEADYLDLGLATGKRFLEEKPLIYFVGSNPYFFLNETVDGFIVSEVYQSNQEGHTKNSDIEDMIKTLDGILKKIT